MLSVFLATVVSVVVVVSEDGVALLPVGLLMVACRERFDEMHIHTMHAKNFDIPRESKSATSISMF